MAKERIDIEALLDWAYRRQCVDKQVAAFTPRGPSASPAGSFGMIAELGTRVDSSSFAARACSMRTPDDALVVHATVLQRLAEMWLEWSASDEVQVWDRARATAEGQDIVKANGVWLRVPLAGGPKARLEQAGTATLVLVNAKAGTRPETHDGWAAPVGAVAGDDAERDARGRKRKRKRGEGIGFDEVIHARAVYLVWHAALCLLVAELDGALERFDVTGPIATPMPWLAEKRVIRPFDSTNISAPNP